MQEAEILSYLRGNIELLSGPGWGSGVYRCSATLLDGLFLPCVAFKSRKENKALAIRRFAETIRDKDQYHTLVELFACAGNRVNYYDILSLQPSRFAIPQQRMAEIGGETSMGWTAFTARMKDGQKFQFGTTYLTEFFDMPEPYSGDDVELITPAERFARPQPGVPLFREKPFFTCYIGGF